MVEPPSPLDAMHNRLRFARKRAGFPNAALAVRKFGWNPSRYRAHENGQNPFKLKDAQDYAAAFNCSVAWLMTGDRYFMQESSGHNIFYVEDVLQIDNVEDIHVPQRGAVCLGVWKDVDLADSTRPIQNRLAPLDPRFPADVQFDILAEGDSSSRIAQDGHLIRCVDVERANLVLRDRDFVVIERRNPQGLIEVSARQVQKNGDIIELLSASRDPRLKSQILLYDGKADKQEIKIIGKVLWVYKEL